MALEDTPAIVRIEHDRGESINDLLSEFGVRAESLAVGVDRLDYTKGIVERLLAIEQLLEDHPWHKERLTMVQIAAPSRTRIPSYVELRRRVVEEVNGLTSSTRRTVETDHADRTPMQPR